MNNHYEKCCDPCEKRMQGEQGPQGIQGPRGQDGLQGPQGIQGMQGIPGNCVNCHPEPHPCPCPEPEFAEVYSSVNQSLAASPGPNMAGQVALLENTIFATANIDISLAASQGKIIINKAGWYDVATGICGALNPIASPLPVWTLSLFKNGVLVTGSTFANMTLSPEQKSNEITADVFVHFNKGDYLELANTSNAAIQLTAPTLGTYALPNSCYVKVIMLRAD